MRTAVVYGDPGIDEVSISATTDIYECTGDKIKHYKVYPEDFGITRISSDEIPSGDRDENRSMFTELLSAKAEQPIVDIVARNFSLAL